MCLLLIIRGLRVRAYAQERLCMEQSTKINSTSDLMSTEIIYSVKANQYSWRAVFVEDRVALSVVARIRTMESLSSLQRQGLASTVRGGSHQSGGSGVMPGR